MTERNWAAPGWAVVLTDGGLTVTRGTETRTLAPAETVRISLGRSWWRWTMYVDNQPSPPRPRHSRPSTEPTAVQAPTLRNVEPRFSDTERRMRTV